jgi:hypothetical protein
MRKIRIKGRCEFPGCVESEALVSPMPLQGFANVSPARGYTTERNHPLFKVPYTGKVLVYPSPRVRRFMLMGEAQQAAAFVIQLPAHYRFVRLTALCHGTDSRQIYGNMKPRYGSRNADEGYIEITKKD